MIVKKILLEILTLHFLHLLYFQLDFTLQFLWVNLLFYFLGRFRYLNRTFSLHLLLNSVEVWLDNF